MRKSFWEWGKSSVTKNLITRMNKKTRSTKSEKWRHTCNSVEIAWRNEQTVAVTSYGRNKNHDDEIKKNQEKANNSPSYRCAAINKTDNWKNCKILKEKLPDFAVEKFKTIFVSGNMSSNMSSMSSLWKYVSGNCLFIWLFCFQKHY